MLSGPDRSIESTALIDSGAAFSVFPLWVASQLGISEDLVQDRQAVGAEGAGFATWSYPPGLSCQVMQLRPDDFSQREPWGKPVKLTPAFADKTVFLLGREDFFAAFTVTFEPGAELRRFVLAQSETASEPDRGITGT